MTKAHLITALVGLAAVVMVTADAAAMYNPKTGRFLQRDPGPDSHTPAAIDSQPAYANARFMEHDSPPGGFIPFQIVRPAVEGEFAPRDPVVSDIDDVESTYDTEMARNSDGSNLYQYVAGHPVTFVDSFGLCKETLTFKGHGMSTKCDMTKKSVAKGKCIPEFMTNGISDGSPMLIVADIAAACDDLCCGATLNLYGCGMGKNEKAMEALAAGCDKIKRVCGYTKLLKYIPGTNITLAWPWNWNCIDVSQD